MEKTGFSDNVKRCQSIGSTQENWIMPPTLLKLTSLIKFGVWVIRHDIICCILLIILPKQFENVSLFALFVMVVVWPSPHLWSCRDDHSTQPIFYSKPVLSANTQVRL